MTTVLKRLFLVFCCVCLFTQTAQAGTSADGKTVGYGSYAVTIPADFKELGNISVNIPLKTEVAGRFPYGSIHSKVFVSGEKVLFIQRMSVPETNTSLRILDGSRVAKWGKDWRENAYSVDTANTTREFSKYISFIKEQGVSVPSSYVVKMYDHLIRPTGLSRVLVFTSKKAEGFSAVPEATALYTVENSK